MSLLDDDNWMVIIIFELEMVGIKFIFLLDVRWNGYVKDSGTEKKQIAAVIFRHLQMFQYYKDLKQYDKSISSLWLPHDKADAKFQSNTLDYKFLSKWNEKCTTSLSEDWRLAEKRDADEKLDQDEFIKRFSNDSRYFSKDSSEEVAEVPDVVSFSRHQFIYEL